jgi:uncharacterized membrane protein YqjE
MDTSEGAPPAGGLKGALARLGESALGLVRTRAELAGVELVEQRERLVLRLALLVAGIVVLAFAALFVGVFIIALFWDSHPLAAIAFVALLYALAGALMIAKSRAIGREAPAPFSATLAELEKDRVRLQRAAQDVTGPAP